MRKMTKPINFFLLVLLTSFCAGTAAAQAPGGVQGTKTIKRADLTSSPGTTSPGKVIWGFFIKGKAGAECALTSDGTNTDEIMIRLTDNGGLTGDPACELSLRFDSLKNHYTFDSVAIAEFSCGNDPCNPSVVSAGTPGSSSLNLTVSGKMKGVVVPSAKSFFRVTPKVRGPANFSPFVEQAKPDLVVSKIDKVSNLGSPGSCGLAVTLANLGDPNWIDRQSFAYGADTSRAVTVSLRKDGIVCGSSSVTLNQFDPGRGMNSANQPVTLSWPGCTFSGTASFTATVDVGNRLFERNETIGKSKTVQLQCPLVVQPK